MDLAGVSMRRVEDITEALWSVRTSASMVSAMAQKAYGQIEAWRNRRIKGEHAYVYLHGLVAEAIRGRGGEERDGADRDRRRCRRLSRVLGVTEGTATAPWSNTTITSTTTPPGSRSPKSSSPKTTRQRRHTHPPLNPGDHRVPTCPAHPLIIPNPPAPWHKLGTNRRTNETTPAEKCVKTSHFAAGIKNDGERGLLFHDRPSPTSSTPSISRNTAATQRASSIVSPSIFPLTGSPTITTRG